MESWNFQLEQKSYVNSKKSKLLCLCIRQHAFHSVYWNFRIGQQSRNDISRGEIMKNKMHLERTRVNNIFKIGK